MRQKQENAPRRIQFVDLKMGDLLNNHSYKVTFTEDGQLKNGFFKSIDHNYPELLAKMTVAASLFKRNVQGNRAAEVLLVFQMERVVGTLSISMNGFEPLNLVTNYAPIEPCKNEEIIPGIETLIEKNIIELLLGRWFLADDNSDPHHLSLVGDISFKGVWSWFTSPMKNNHLFEIPKTSVNLTINDWENFPHNHNTAPINKPFFRAGMLNSISNSTHSTQIENLAKYPEAHKQKFVAALKILLTYQPDIIKMRLFELFGDMALNYTSLGAQLRVRYEREYPKYCNAESDREPFVNFIMQMYQEHYDNLYRLVVFYAGCDSNRFGVPLPATCITLYQNSSYYKTIKQWIIEQNSTFYSNDSESLKFKPLELEKKYHQIWRDAFAPTIKELHFSIFKLKNTSDLLVEFHNKFNMICKEYYEKEYLDLKLEDNLNFCQQLHELQKKYYIEIKKQFAFASVDFKTFDSIVSRLCDFKFQVNFCDHLGLETVINQFFSRQLLNKVKKLILEQGIIEFAFSSIDVALEINEKRLNHFIELLEKQNDPIANLTCGLLLEGKIETTAEILDNCKAYDEYMEKRTHDAITFYTKAARDIAIKPIAEFLLWDIKMTTQCISIQNRLAKYDLSPEETPIINSYKKANQRAAVSIPLLKGLGLFKVDENASSTSEKNQYELDFLCGNDQVESNIKS